MGHQWVLIDDIELCIGILYFINGSLEEYPTWEQEENVKIATSIFIAFGGIVELLFKISKKIRKKGTSQK